MPGATHGASVRHSKTTHSGKRVHRIEIEMHGEGGHTVTHHYESSERGRYNEPSSEVYHNHAEMMPDLHATIKEHGCDKGQEGADTCAYCSPSKEKGDDEKGDSGGTGKRDMGGKKDYA